MGRVDSFAAPRAVLRSGYYFARNPRLTEPEPRDDEADALLADRVQEAREDMRREEEP